MPTLAAQLSTIQAVFPAVQNPNASYPAVTSVNVFYVTFSGTNSVARSALRVVLNGTRASDGHAITKHVMVFAIEPAAVVTALMQGAGALFDAMAAGTATDQQHANVDRGCTIEFNGTQVQ